MARTRKTSVAGSVVPKRSGKLSGLAGFVSRVRPTVAPSKVGLPRLGSKMGFPMQGRTRKDR